MLSKYLYIAEQYKTDNQPVAVHVESVFGKLVPTQTQFLNTIPQFGYVPYRTDSSNRYDPHPLLLFNIVDQLLFEIAVDRNPSLTNQIGDGQHMLCATCVWYAYHYIRHASFGFPPSSAENTPSVLMIGPSERSERM